MTPPSIGTSSSSTHTTRTMSRALAIAFAGCFLPELGLGEASAASVTLSDVLGISIPDQSQWGTGTVVPPGEWELKLVNIHENATIGEIVQSGITIRNPAHASAPRCSGRHCVPSSASARS